MERRKVLKLFIAAGSLAASGSFLYPLSKYLLPSAATSQTEKVTVEKKDVPAGEALDIVVNGTPAILINRPGKGYVALTRVCTHLGCLVDYQKEQQRLFCPCHAGVYSLEGRVLAGPPPKPLKQFALDISGDTIIIG